MFYLVGLGLGDCEDITVKGLRIVKGAKRVYLEAYTSILTVGVQQLESHRLAKECSVTTEVLQKACISLTDNIAVKPATFPYGNIRIKEEFYGRKVIVADRDMVELKSEEILEGADVDDVACLVVGDPLGATTHADLLLRARDMGIRCEIIHNASIVTAVGVCGLQLYSFGETVSIVFWTDNWKPDSFYDKIIENRKRGLHTLCLLDIKMKEQTIENLMRGREIYEPPRFMSVSQAGSQLLEIVKRKRDATDATLEDSKPQSGESWFTEDTLCVGLARIGSPTQMIHAGSLKEISTVDFGSPLHSMIVVGHMHPLEQDYLRQFAIDQENFKNISKYH